MTDIDPREFWKNPRAYRGLHPLLDKYINSCLPQHYYGYGKWSARIVAAFAAYFPGQPTILELGCSVGRNIHHLQKAGYKYITRVEINTEATELAREWVGEGVGV